ncbi:unnamed protein product [Rotaria sp. Silwood1]|nr:unnamed protein product [Rotaria sp. Silwood1]
MFLSKISLIDWKNFCRDICAIHFVNNLQKVGGKSAIIFIIKYILVTLGPGHIVEIDESAFGKRKYNRGRLVKTQWEFDGVDIITRQCFLVEIEKKDAATSLPINQNYISPGTTIIRISGVLIMT